MSDTELQAGFQHRYNIWAFLQFQTRFLFREKRNSTEYIQFFFSVTIGVIYANFDGKVIKELNNFQVSKVQPLQAKPLIYVLHKMYQSSIEGARITLLSGKPHIFIVTMFEHGAKFFNR